MKPIQAGWAALRRAGELVSQATDPSPKSGVWVTHITRPALFAGLLFSLGPLCLVALVWSATGRPEFLWGMLLVFGCMLPLSFVGKAVATALDTDAERPPSDKLFAAWAVLTALIGLPLSHLFLYAASMVQPFSTSPLIEKYLPEMFIVVKVAITYWRLVIIRLWFERLASEKLKRQAAEQGQALAETRLNLLEAQIEPHFLFNTLTSVQHLVRHDAVQADRLLVQLVSYLRQAIPDLRASASTLGRECELVRTYLAIVHMRVGERLAVDVQCPPQIGEAAFPALVLHTLVENAIKHGVEMTPGPVSISVRARHRVQGEQESIEVSVQDNGTGMGKAHEGVGLGNIRDRLALAYGPRAQLDITDAPGGGACITVRIPVSGLVGVL